MRSRQTSLTKVDAPVTYGKCRSWKFEEIEYRRILGAAPAVPADLKGVILSQLLYNRVSSHISRKHPLPTNTSEHPLQKITPKTCSPACPAVKLGDTDPKSDSKGLPRLLLCSAIHGLQR
jgi:hypothetical protein